MEAALLRIAVNPPTSLREQLAEPHGIRRAVRRILPRDDAIASVVIDQLEELFHQATSRQDHDGSQQHAARIAMSPNGRFLVSSGGIAGPVGEVMIVDSETDRTLMVPGLEGSAVLAAIDDDGALTTASTQGVIRFWTPDLRIRAPSVNLTRALEAVARRADGRVVVSTLGGGHRMLHERRSSLVEEVRNVDGTFGPASLHPPAVASCRRW